MEERFSLTSPQIKWNLFMFVPIENVFHVLLNCPLKVGVARMTWEYIETTDVIILVHIWDLNMSAGAF